MRRIETIEIKESLFENIQNKQNKQNNRDIGKIFRITEMSAMALERWHTKAISFFALNINDSDSVKNIKDLEKESAESSATTTFLGNIDAIKMLQTQNLQNIEGWLDLQNEHLYCYEIFDKVKQAYIKLEKSNIEDYIEEIETLQYLRDKAIEFNCGNFINGNR